MLSNACLPNPSRNGKAIPFGSPCVQAFRGKKAGGEGNCSPPETRFSYGGLLLSSFQPEPILNNNPPPSAANQQFPSNSFSRSLLFFPALSKKWAGKRGGHVLAAALAFGLRKKKPYPPSLPPARRDPLEQRAFSFHCKTKIYYSTSLSPFSPPPPPPFFEIGESEEEREAP